MAYFVHRVKALRDPSAHKSRVYVIDDGFQVFMPLKMNRIDVAKVVIWEQQVHGGY